MSTLKWTRATSAFFIRGVLQARTFTTSTRCKIDISEVKIADRMSLKEKTVLVSGGGRGIGFAVCKAVAQQGGNVAVIDALPEPVEEFHTLGDKYGVKAFYTRGDVTNQASLEGAFDRAVQATGEIHGCVTAAGIVLQKGFFDHGWDESQKLINVNILGTFWLAKLASQHIAKHGKGGSIVMIASLAAQGIKIPEQEISVYNMSKAAVKGLAGPLSVEVAPYRIRVNTISPGVISSPMTNALKDQHPELYRMFEQAAPLRRMGVPQDLTPAIIYLLSEASSFTTGIDMPITGGFHAGTSMEWGR